jgi:hypothetical protein
LLENKALSIAVSSYQLTGNSIALEKNQSLSGASGTFFFAGNNISLVISRPRRRNILIF